MTNRAAVTAATAECHECGSVSTGTVTVAGETAGTCAYHASIVEYVMRRQLGLEVGPMVVTADLETPSYTFRTVGTTRAQVVSLMRAAWARHRAQTGATDTWTAVRDDVVLSYLIPGMSLRDSQDF